MKKNIIIGFVAILLLGCSTELPKQAYIDNLELYKEFTFTKELNNSITVIEQGKRAGLDSVELELKMLSRQIEMNQGSDENQIRLFQYKQSEYQMKGQQMQEQLEMLNGEYNEKIWTRLNEYVKAYGQENDYQILFGGMGQGTIMFCDSTMNITSDILEYVNNRYSGEK